MRCSRAEEALPYCLYLACQWELLYLFSVGDLLWRARVAWPVWSMGYLNVRSFAEGGHLQRLWCEFWVAWTGERG